MCITKFILLMKSPFRKRSLTGFTVVELLIALSILIIIGTMTAVIFRSTQQSFINAKAFQHVIDLARRTVIRIHDELQATFIDVSGLVPFVGIDAGGDNSMFIGEIYHFFKILRIATHSVELEILSGRVA